MEMPQELLDENGACFMCGQAADEADDWCPGNEDNRALWYCHRCGRNCMSCECDDFVDHARRE